MSSLTATRSRGLSEPSHQKKIGGAREHDARLGERGERLAFLEFINDGQDPITHPERVDAVGKPAVVGLRSEAGMKIEVPHVAMKVGNRVLMDLGRRNDEDRVGKAHDPWIEEGEEVKEQGMGDKPILVHREANMEAIGRPGMAHLHSGLDLEAKVEPKVTAAMDIRIPPVVVGRRPGGFEHAVAAEHGENNEQELG